MEERQVLQHAKARSGGTINVEASLIDPHEARLRFNNGEEWIITLPRDPSGRSLAELEQAAKSHGLKVQLERVRGGLDGICTASGVLHVAAAITVPAAAGALDLVNVGACAGVTLTDTTVSPQQRGFTVLVAGVGLVNPLGGAILAGVGYIAGAMAPVSLRSGR